MVPVSLSIRQPIVKNDLKFCCPGVQNLGCEKTAASRKAYGTSVFALDVVTEISPATGHKPKKTRSR